MWCPVLFILYDYDFLIHRNPDYQKGILQTIGFKEFVPYLKEFDETEDALINNYMRDAAKSDAAASRPVPKGLKVLHSCLDELKLVTKRYSRKQIKWINNRFLGNQTRQVPDLYELDTSDVSQWNAAVLGPAEDVVKCYIDDKVPILKPMAKLQSSRAGLNEEVRLNIQSLSGTYLQFFLFQVTKYCEDCERILIGEYQWNIHRQSNKHKKIVARNKKYQNYPGHQPKLEN